MPAAASASRPPSGSSSDSESFDSARSFGDDARSLGPPDADDDADDFVLANDAEQLSLSQPQAGTSSALNDDTPAYNVDGDITPFNPSIFGRVLQSPSGTQALVVHNNPFLQLASVAPALPPAVSRSGVAATNNAYAPPPLTEAPISGPHHMVELRQTASFPPNATISKQALAALVSPAQQERPYPPLPTIAVPPKSKRPKIFGKSKADIEREHCAEMDAAVKMQRYQEQCRSVGLANERIRAGEAVNRRLREDVEKWVSKVLGDVQKGEMLKGRDSEMFAETLGGLLALDRLFEGPGRCADSQLSTQVRAIKTSVQTILHLFIDNRPWYSKTPVFFNERIRTSTLDFICELYWGETSLRMCQLIVGQVLSLATYPLPPCPSLERTIYTRVMPLLCHAIMTQPAYLLPPDAATDARAITPRLEKLGRVLVRWEYAVDMVIQNCGHGMLDVCLRKCMELPFARDTSHEMHAHFQLSMCTAFAPIVAKDPLLQTHLMLGSVSYFSYALAAFDHYTWGDDPWKPVLQLHFLYKNIIQAIIEVLDALASLPTFAAHSQHLENIFRVLSDVPFRKFALKKRELGQKLYDVVEQHESGWKLSEAPFVGADAWFHLLNCLGWADPRKMDKVVDMWFGKGKSLETLRPPEPITPSEALLSGSGWGSLLWSFLSGPPAEAAVEDASGDSSTQLNNGAQSASGVLTTTNTNTSATSGSPQSPFNWPLFCWAIVAFTNAIQYGERVYGSSSTNRSRNPNVDVGPSSLIAHLTRHNVVSKLYKSWLANTAKDPSLQVAYASALVHCCRSSWAFAELVQQGFDRMIEEGLKNALERLIPTPDSIARSFWLWSNPQYFAWQLSTDKQSLWILVNAVAHSSEVHCERLRSIVRESRQLLESLQPMEMRVFLVKVLWNLFKECGWVVDLCVV